MASAKAERYGADCLREIAEATGTRQIADTLPDGTHCRVADFRKKPLTIAVKDGMVTHLGLSVFSEADRASMAKTHVADFVERFLLEYYISGKDNAKLQQTCVVESIELDGNPESLLKLDGDSTVAFTYSLASGRRYKAEWTRDGSPIFAISFPASTRLLTGWRMDEGARRLPERIAMADTACRLSAAPADSLLQTSDLLPEELKILKGDFCVIPLINSDRYYYFDEDSVARLVFGHAFPVESLANLLVTGEIPNSITAKVRMNRYGQQFQEFEAQLNALLNAMIAEGCRPYFGVKGVYPAEDRITALFEMINAEMGYEHLMSIVFDTRSIAMADGTIDIRLTPYLPLNDIDNLFAR